MSTSLADVAERLMSEFEGSVPLDTVTQVVRGCQQDLSGQVPAEAFPELIERLARHRLAELAGDTTVNGGSSRTSNHVASTQNGDA